MEEELVEHRLVVVVGNSPEEDLVGSNHLVEEEDPVDKTERVSIGVFVERLL